MAQKKSGGSSRNGRDSNSKNLGLKKYNNIFVKPGDIIIRQKGLKFHPGVNVFISKDYTLISLVFGYVYLKKNKKNTIIYIL